VRVGLEMGVVLGVVVLDGWVGLEMLGEEAVCKW
jgi:hypothetical protein